MRHYRISTRADWDGLVAEIERWVAARGETAALWLNGDKMSVRFVAGAGAMSVTTGWRVLYAVTPGEPRPTDMSDIVWQRYDQQRQMYEAGLGRGHKQPHEPEILGVRHPPERHDPYAKPQDQRKSRSDKGISRGPRHLRTRGGA